MVFTPTSLYFFLLPGISDFGFPILKRKSKSKPRSYNGVPALIGISNSTIFINNPIKPVSDIIIAIVELKWFKFLVS